MLLVGASTPVAGAVQRQRRERAVGVGDPEPLAEAGGEVGRVGPPGRRAVAAERVEQLGARERGLVDVALHLDQRDGAGRAPPVGEPDGVVRVLPALVGQAAAGRVVVGDEAVAVAADPAERRLQVRQQGAHLVGGQAPAPRVAQQADPQRCRVDRAVVERREALCRRGGGAAALVQDLARLLAGVRVGGAALRAGERAQGAAREGDVVREQERGRPEGVAAEQGEVPRGARAAKTSPGWPGSVSSSASRSSRARPSRAARRGSSARTVSGRASRTFAGGDSGTGVVHGQ